MKGAELPFMVVGAVAATGRGSRQLAGTAARGATIAVAPAIGVWRSNLASPARRRAETISQSLADDGIEISRRARRNADELVSQVLRRAGAELTAAGVIDDLLDALLSSDFVDRFVSQLLNHPGTERLLCATLEDPGLERLLARTIESDLVEFVALQLIASDEMQSVIERVAGAPEVRAVVAQQTAGFAGDMADGMRSRTVSADDKVERLARSIWRRRAAGAQ